MQAVKESLDVLLRCKTEPSPENPSPETALFYIKARRGLRVIAEVGPEPDESIIPPCSILNSVVGGTP